MCMTFAYICKKYHLKKQVLFLNVYLVEGG